MTKKDYELIANAILRGSWKENNEQIISIDNLLHEMKLALHSDNPNFNAEKFDKACRF
jgi:hypothetical protein